MLLWLSLALTLITSSNCAHPPYEPWKGQWWVGDHTKAAIIGELREIKATDMEFSKYLCVSDEDLIDLLTRILKRDQFSIGNPD
jgi:hypothetical protein